MAALLQRGDLRGLVGRQYVGEDIIGRDAEASCHSVRGLRVVTGDHDHAQAPPMQGGDGLGSMRLGLVGEGQQRDGVGRVAGIEAQQSGHSGAVCVQPLERGRIDRHTELRTPAQAGKGPTLTGDVAAHTATWQ